MARDLSASPWRSAAIAPLCTPLAMLLLAFLESVLERKLLRPTGDLGSHLEMVLAVWLVAYLYMWILAVPIMLLTRRWITWGWVRLIILGAFLGALPWIVGIAITLAELADSRSRADLWREFARSIFYSDNFMVMKFSALGSLVAGAFCLLQLYVFRAPSNNALEQTRGQQLR